MGVTPEMLLWWFSNIGGSMSYAGTEETRYRVWHPRDHVRWELTKESPGGGVGEGARFHIVEAFGRDVDQWVDTVDRVEKLDLTGIRLTLRFFGLKFFQLEHTWARGDRGTGYVSVLDLGHRWWLLAPINRLLRAKVFTNAMESGWIRHNVEEVGRLEHFLPALYAQQVRESN